MQHPGGGWSWAGGVGTPLVQRGTELPLAPPLGCQDLSVVASSDRLCERRLSGGGGGRSTSQKAYLRVILSLIVGGIFITALTLALRQ